MARQVRSYWDRCAHTSPIHRQLKLSLSRRNPAPGHWRLRFEQVEPRRLLSATPPDPPLDEPTVINGVLWGTLEDDVRDQRLDAKQYDVNAVFGDYGNDHLIANSRIVSNNDNLDSPSPEIDISRFANVLNGGHGRDRLVGSGFDDLLISRADSREPVIAQSWDSSDDPYDEINPTTNTYYGDQPIEGDDVLIGGGGADLFYFQTVINAKERIILEHVRSDGTINWSGVAGENDNVHDHWVDGLGDELIADFNRDEGDYILIGGHTTQVYKPEYIDSNGDNIFDSTVLHIWSNQGNNGGAHNKDLLGTITVANALLTADDYATYHANYGIVHTVGELDEAIRPYSGVPDDGLRPVVSKVEEYQLPEDAVLFVPGDLAFTGHKDDYGQIDHYRDLELSNGTVALTFTAEDISGQNALFSKDASGQDVGGHLTAFVTNGRVKVRLQSTDHSRWLQTPENSIRQGEEYHLAISFGANGFGIYLDGVIRGWEAEFEQAIDTNRHELALGGNIWGRSPDNPLYLRDEFTGTVTDFTIYGRQLTHGEVAELGGHADPPLVQPTVVDGVLWGTLEDDVRDQRLDAKQYDVNAVFGDYGNDHLIANSRIVANNDNLDSPSPEIDISRFANVLNGGHGRDRLVGSGFDDLLISRADSREPVIAQSWDSSDDPYDEINPTTNTYYGDQPIEGDDVLIGGGGADLFYFQTVINAKERIILEHVRSDGTINWSGVAGENDNVHDHWVDGLGDELIADFNRDEGDYILIGGHTTQVYKPEYIDSNGDNIFDSTVLHIWSNQGNNGGAHNKDLLGTITVANALLTADDYATYHANYGIVHTVGELDEAIRPYSGVPDDGLRPVVSKVEEYQLPEDAVLFVPGDLAFTGHKDDYGQIDHYRDLELSNGTVALTFTAEDISGQNALFSKDASGQDVGGHLTAFVTNGRVKVRLQSTDHSRWLQTPENSIRQGEEYHLAISFGANGFQLYLDGTLVDSRIDFDQGINTNFENLALGGNIWGRSPDNPLYLRDEFTGTISDFTIYNRQLAWNQIAGLGGEANVSLPLVANPAVSQRIQAIFRDEQHDWWNESANSAELAVWE